MTEQDRSDNELDYRHRWKRRCEAIHRVQLSTLYHHKRERFFDSLDRSFTALTLVGATAATAAILKNQVNATNTIELWFSLIAAIAACFQVAFSPGAKATLHKQLAADMRRLWSSFEQAGEEWSHKQCDTFAAELLSLEAGESAQLGALVTQCENEIALATGRFEDIRELGLWRSLWMHLWNFDVTTIELLSAEKVQVMRRYMQSQPPRGN